MIEKLKETYTETTRGKIAQKINEIIAALNPILEERESGIKVYEEAQDMYDNAILDALKDKQVDVVVEPAENVQDEIDKAKREGRVIFPNPKDIATILTKSLRMDKEFAEEECVRLQNELERTRKALDVAVDALKRLEKELYFNNAKQTGHIADSVMSIPSIALKQITALEHKE